MIFDNRVYKATWYKDGDKVTKEVTFGFFRAQNGYSEYDIDSVDQLQVGQTDNFSETKWDHFVRRVK